MVCFPAHARSCLETAVLHKRAEYHFFERHFHRVVHEGNLVMRYRNTQLHCAYGPAVESDKGHKVWWVDGKKHRTDGPAIEHADGSKEWFVSDKHHRTDGAACEWRNGWCDWWFDGTFYFRAYCGWMINKSS